MKRFLLFLFVLNGNSFAETYKVATLDRFSLQINKFLANREPMTPEIDIKGYRGSLNLEWNVGLLNDVLKWRNNVVAAGTESQFKTVYWQYELALPLYNYVELTYNHKSQHRLDSEQPIYNDKKQNFPVMDSYGIRLIFFNRENK